MIEKNPQLSNGCGQKTIKKEVFVMVENARYRFMYMRRVHWGNFCIHLRNGILNWDGKSLSDPHQLNIAANDNCQHNCFQFHQLS
jgi:hypothetical protein